MNDDILILSPFHIDFTDITTAALVLRQDPSELHFLISDALIPRPGLSTDRKEFTFDADNPTLEVEQSFTWNVNLGNLDWYLDGGFNVNFSAEDLNGNKICGDGHVDGVKEKICKAIIDAIKAVVDAILEFLQSLFDWVFDMARRMLEPIFAPIFDAIKAQVDRLLLTVMPHSPLTEEQKAEFRETFGQLWMKSLQILCTITVVIVAISHVADAFGPVAIALVGATVSLIITGAIIYLVPEIPYGLKGGLETVPGVLMTGGAAISSFLLGTYLYFGDIGHIVADCFVEAILMWNVVLPVGILAGAFATVDIILSLFFSFMGIWMAAAAEANREVNPTWAIVCGIAAAVFLGFGVYETSKAAISIWTPKGFAEFGFTGQVTFSLFLGVIDISLILLLLATLGFILYVNEHEGS